MNESNHTEDDRLETATKALRMTPVLESPPKQFVTATIESLNLRCCADVRPSSEIISLQNDRNQRMFRLARYSGLAIAFLLVAFGILALWNGGARSAFGQVIENLKKATSVSFTSKQKLGSQPVIEMKYYLQGNFMRIEMPGKQEAFDAKLPLVQTFILNGETKEVVQVDYANKTGRRFQMDEKSAKQFINPIEELRTLTDKDAELIGDEDLDGRKTKVYRLKELHGLFGIVAKVDGKLWVDRQSGLPTKIVIETDPADHKTNLSLTFADFKWNEALKGDLFKLAIPEGFKVTEGNSGGNLDKTEANK
jgi:outer membrane lipoprotein-sorting protein